MKKRGFWIALVVSMSMLSGVSAANATDIGVAWAGKSGMAKRVTTGFEQGMKEKAPDIKIEYVKELGSIDELAEVAAKWEKEKNGMVLLRSNGAKWLGQNPRPFPHLSVPATTRINWAPSRIFRLPRAISPV